MYWSLIYTPYYYDYFVNKKHEGSIDGLHLNNMKIIINMNNISDLEKKMDDESL